MKLSSRSFNRNTKDYSYDYADIGQFSIDRRLWGEFTNKQFEKIGRDIVKVNFNKGINELEI